MISSLRSVSGPLLLWTAAALSLAAGVIWHPVATAAATAGLLVIVFCWAPAHLSARCVWWLLAIILAGYAFFGRTFAHVGYGPVYVGEVALVVTVCASLTRGTLWSPLRSPAARLLLIFVTWCAVRTVPFLSVYGTDALRDAAIWGYALFALVTAGVLLRHGSSHAIARGYGRLIWVFLFWLSFAGAIRILAPSQSAALGEGLSVGSLLKPGDVSVHLAGIASFVLLGLHRFRARDKGRAWIKEWLLWPIWTANFLLFGSQNRGGLLSILIALAVVLLLWNRGGWGKLAMVCLCILSVFVFWELEVDVGATRKVSPEQILVNVSSLAGDAAPVNEGTRQWRLSWWGKIRDYTVYGDFFWEGKGFGLNLADDDGFQTDAAHSLRSPHNGHLTILARAGVPGFVLWILLQGSLWLGLLQRYLRARREGQMERAAFIVWILAYLAALTVNGAFDVYLEGPQGGIWFWTVFGVGLSIVAEPVMRPCAAAARRTVFVQRVMPARAV